MRSGADSDRSEVRRSMEIPEFKSLEEEEQFWSEHSALEFLGRGEPVEIDASPAKSSATKRQTQLISLRVSKHVLEGTKHRAAILGVPYQTLIQIWLAERLENELDCTKREPSRAGGKRGSHA